jgi:steroid delta-isomerase-like uncharacterized protein
MTSTNNTPKDNAQLVTEYFKDGWNQGRFDEHAVSDDYVVHVNRPENTYTFEEVKALADNWCDAFPDLRLEILDVISTSEKVAIHYQWTGTHEAEILGLDPTGRTVEVAGMGHFDVEDGQLVEAWYTDDIFGLLKQLGAVSE